jgi:acetyl esterase
MDISAATLSSQERVPEALRLVEGARLTEPAPEALEVIARLSRSLKPSDDIELIRRHYENSRRPLLVPLEDVESTFQVCPRYGHGPSLHVIRPKGIPANHNAPAIVYLHGGGWTVGTFDIYEPLCRQLANATGSIVIWARYRLAPEHPFPAAFDDTRAALRWVYDNHRWLGIDPAKIGIAGDSAGGNLAAAVCIAERDERSGFQPRFQILIYPCLDMGASLPSHHELSQGYLLTYELYRWYRHNYIGDNEKPLHWRLSPLFVYEVSQLPPAVVLYAGFDPLRDEAAHYASRLREGGVPVETLYFPDMIHGFMTMGGAIPAANAAVQRVADALERISCSQ